MPSRLSHEYPFAPRVILARCVTPLGPPFPRPVEVGGWLVYVSVQRPSSDCPATQENLLRAGRLCGAGERWPGGPR